MKQVLRVWMPQGLNNPLAPGSCMISTRMLNMSPDSTQVFQKHTHNTCIVMLCINLNPRDMLKVVIMQKNVCKFVGEKNTNGYVVKCWIAVKRLQLTPIL